MNDDFNRQMCAAKMCVSLLIFITIMLMCKFAFGGTYAIVWNKESRSISDTVFQTIDGKHTIAIIGKKTTQKMLFESLGTEEVTFIHKTDDQATVPIKNQEFHIVVYSDRIDILKGSFILILSLE